MRRLFTTILALGLLAAGCGSDDPGDGGGGIISLSATNVNGATITSSPAPTPQAAIAVATAAVPLEHTCACRLPRRSASSFSSVTAFQWPLRAPSKP